MSKFVCCLYSVGYPESLDTGRTYDVVEAENPDTEKIPL